MKNKKSKLNKGQAVLTAVLFFMVTSLIITSGSYSVSHKESKNSRDIVSSKKSFFLAESGVEDISYRIINSKNYDTSETLSLDGSTTTTSVVDISGAKEITSTSTVSELVRKIKSKLSVGETGSSFHYGVQVGNGGFVLENSSLINGNVFSNGTITGSNSNLIKGDVISAGPSGTISGVHATGTAYAHSIINSNIDKDAYYTIISGGSVGGTRYSGSVDQATTSMPMSDSFIEELKNTASSTIINSPCPYQITSDITLGPVKINCDLKIKNSPIITIAGNIWVKGNIEIENTPTIKMASSLGSKSVAIIADNPDNRVTSSKIELANSTVFQNSGTEGSYILFISQNNSAENGGSEKAIYVENSASGDVIVYASHGEINLKNSSNMREVSAYRVRLSNSAQVSYKSGLVNLLFTSGPSGGGYSIDSWQETQ